MRLGVSYGSRRCFRTEGRLLSNGLGNSGVAIDHVGRERINGIVTRFGARASGCGTADFVHRLHPPSFGCAAGPKS